MHIQLISAEQTWPLRHRVMWPAQPLDFVQLPDDSTGKHFGLFAPDNRLVSVVSLFEEGTHAQFRKFATEVSEQGKGYGSALLQHVMQYAQKQHITKLWCHARENKTGFYQKMGMGIAEEPFLKDGLLYVRMEKVW